MFCLQAPGADLVISRSILLTSSRTEPHKGMACHTLTVFSVCVFAYISSNGVLGWIRGVHTQRLALFFSTSLLINTVFVCSP